MDTCINFTCSGHHTLGQFGLIYSMTIQQTILVEFAPRRPRELLCAAQRLPQDGAEPCRLRSRHDRPRRQRRNDMMTCAQEKKLKAHA